MTALDYWRAKVPIPAHEPDDLPVSANGDRLPDESSLLRWYIFDRQMNTFLTKLMITRWLPAPWLRHQWFRDWAVNAEFAVVRQQLAMNRPVMLGLWGFENWNSGHQVLCYGYDTNPVRLYVYDPNNPDEESVLTPVSPGQGVDIRGVATGRQSQYRGSFWMDVYNWGETPPYTPPYRDIAIAQGLNTTPTGPDADVGAGCSWRSPSAIRADTLRGSCTLSSGRGTRGTQRRRLGGAFESGFTGLQPGESRTIARNIQSFGQTERVQTIDIGRLTQRDHWQDVPAGASGAVSRRQLRLWRRRTLVVDQWVDVPESSRSDIDTGVTLQPGDDFELQGSGLIWAGVWFTGTNGPEGWTDRVETNPSSPMHSRAQAHPFALIGRFGNEPYFYIGTRAPRRAYGRSTPARLCLRINDNAPAYGSGSFRCRVLVWRWGVPAIRRTRIRRTMPQAGPDQSPTKRHGVRAFDKRIDSTGEFIEQRTDPVSGSCNPYKRSRGPNFRPTG